LTGRFNTTIVPPATQVGQDGAAAVAGKMDVLDMTAASPKPKPAAAAVDALAGLFAPDMKAVDHLIHRHMASTVGLIPNLASYLIDAGGKRVRPLVTLASCGLFGPVNEASRCLAAAVEFIHTATLLHDDVVDESGLRRGKASANAVFGNAASVLVGDFLFARAFMLMVEADDIATLGVLSKASSVIAEGEVLQLTSAGDAEQGLSRYMAIVEAKTAALFAAAAEVGARAAGRADMAGGLNAYGRNLGIAFQLADDALDYAGLSARMGKNAGDDFREGKITLPVLLAQESGDAEERAFWRRTMGGVQSDGDFDRAVAILRRRNAIDETLETARGYADAAKAALAAAPDSDVRDALMDLADFVVDRGY
jgi:octaprenyl-diphosphate synthase